VTRPTTLKALHLRLAPDEWLRALPRGRAQRGHGRWSRPGSTSSTTAA